MADHDTVPDGGRPDPATAIADRLDRFEHVVEVGIGRRPDVARTLAERGVVVTATDVHARAVPDGVTFVVDDVTDPDLAVYEGADLVFARNCPPELHAALLAVAEAVDAACAFTTLGGDPPAVDARPETIPGGETLFWARGSERP